MAGRARAGRRRRSRPSTRRSPSSGGLYVLVTERHESRRIDNQLRGRSGRQGDPGETQFYLSLEDDLMRLFKSDMVDCLPAPVQRAGRRADRGEDGHQRHPIGAVAGRGAELRDPQGRPEVRRRPEPAAPGHLRRASSGDRGRGHPGAGPHLHQRHGHRLRPGRHRRGLPRVVGPRAAVDRAQAALPGRRDRGGARGPLRRRPGRPVARSSSSTSSSRMPSTPTTRARSPWARRSRASSSAA